LGEEFQERSIVGLRVYAADGSNAPRFSLLLQYFEQHGLPLDWLSFLDNFQRHWPADEDIYVCFVLDGLAGNGAARSGNPRWRRLTEVRARTAKSVFQFDMQGSVAKSTHAGIPWLRYIRQHLGDRVHFWPFDGWTVPANRSVIAEVYPALWSRSLPMGGRTPDQQDAFAVVKWLQEADRNVSLGKYFRPRLELEERRTAEIEGWILGVQQQSVAEAALPVAQEQLAKAGARLAAVLNSVWPWRSQRPSPVILSPANGRASEIR
jgi:hypothetical protein